MAFAAGSRARLSLVSGALSIGVLQPQPPVLGVVTDVTGTTLTINMENGVTLSEDKTNFDEIVEATGDSRDAFIDKVVSGWITPPSPPAPGVPYSSTYTGRVVDVYFVNDALTVLIKSLLNGMFFELPAANVNVLPNR